MTGYTIAFALGVLWGAMGGFCIGQNLSELQIAKAAAQRDTPPPQNPDPVPQQRPEDWRFTKRQSVIDSINQEFKEEVCE